MTDDSRPTAVGLAQAVLDWIDPVLLDAVRAAEAQCDLHELERLRRDPIARILDRRSRPQRGRVVQMGGRPPAIAAWDRAWDAVINALRLKVENGEIILTGRMTRPDMRMDPEPIPSTWASELDFDVRGAAIFVRDQTYVAVTVAKPRGSDGPATPVDTSGQATGPDVADDLTLLEAMTRWCDARLVARIQDEERKLIAYELHQFPKPKLLDPSQWRQPTDRSWMVPTDYVFLTAAWDELTTDFQRRIERGEIYLRGVLSGDDPAAVTETIPNFWAAELMFDLRANAVRRDSRTYLAVMVSKQAPTGPPVAKNEAPPAASEPRGPITPHTAATLTDEAVFALLDEYARRVVEDEDSSLKLPVKVSFIPILRRRLRWRFENGENAPTLAAEAAALEKWIKTKVDGHQTPSAGHIENELREEHRRLKAQHPRPASKDRQS